MSQPTSSAEVTVVVPAHGSPTLLARLLDALDSGATATGTVLDVIVSDDASPQPLADTIDVEAPRSLRLRIVRSDRNGGPGAARNRALRLVETDWVAFLDADMVAGEAWVRRLLHVAATSRADGVEGRVEISDSAPPTPFTHATEFSSAGVHHGAGNVVYRTTLLRRVGGFDERFYDARRKLHFREDTELHFRLLASGASIEYDAELVASHPPLQASYLGPLRLARRYYFDPLLASLHPAGFREMNEARRVGPVNLRRARHDAALAAAGGTMVAVLALFSGSRRASAAAAGVAGAGWAATAVALAWRRQVRPAHVLPLAAVSLATPWVYLWNYYRGVIRYRHRPRL